MENDDEMPAPKFLRLKNGDDIICELVTIENDDNKIYHLVNPLKVIYAPSGETGYMQVAFIPWVFMSIVKEQEFDINSKEVLFVTEVSEKMHNYYWSNLDYLVNMLQELEDESMTGEPETKSLHDENLENISNILEEIIESKKRTYH